MFVVVYTCWAGPRGNRKAGRRHIELFTDKVAFQNRFDHIAQPSPDYENEIHFVGPVEEINYFNNNLSSGPRRE